MPRVHIKWVYIMKHYSGWSPVPNYILNYIPTRYQLDIYILYVLTRYIYIYNITYNLLKYNT